MPSDRARAFRHIACAALLCGSFAASAEAADFRVELNESRPVHFSAPVATVMIGNPAVADVSVHDKQTVYVLGRAYGKTTFTALDAEGKQIALLDVYVVSQSGSIVTLMRGADQNTYSCEPRCEPVVNPSDAAATFSRTMGQSAATAGAVSAASLGAATAGQPVSE